MGKRIARRTARAVVAGAVLVVGGSA